jgi:hypothetical protein
MLENGLQMLLQYCSNTKTYTFKNQSDFETNLDDFSELLVHSKPISTLRAFGLLVL